MLTYPAVMIKSVDTFVTTSAMFAELAYLDREQNHSHIMDEQVKSQRWYN